jgi:hypothetical protein
MPRSIVLSVGGENRTLTLDSRSANGAAVFTEKVGPLVGRLRLVARTAPNSAGTVLRTTLKLEKAKVIDCSADSCGKLPEVQYTQVWSHDVSVVTASSTEERTSLYDLTAALIANADVKSVIVDGATLDA